MPDKFSKTFIQAFENKDTESLLAIPKSDLHKQKKNIDSKKLKGI